LDNGVARFDNIRKVTEDYVASLQKESGDARALLCHHFLQYNAVLSGGQYLMGKIAEKENIDTTNGPDGWILDPSGVAFYIFNGLKHPAGRVQQYMSDLDRIPLTDADREEMLSVMKRIYQQTSDAMDAAHAIAVQEGYKPQAVKDKQNDATKRDAPGKMRLSLKQLRAFDGQNGPVYVSLRGRILDVSSSKESYGPGGAYGIFGGRDVTKSLAMMDLSETALDQPGYVPETEAGKKSLEKWWKNLSEKYPEVGQVVEPLQLSLNQLREFDGTSGSRILMSLKGKIFDVTKSKESYGPGGSYCLFAGRDVTKSLSCMNLSEDFLDHPTYIPDTEDAKKSLEKWWKHMSEQYEEVGEVVNVA
jgi:predicted heme/steroid binding protein